MTENTIDLEKYGAAVVWLNHGVSETDADFRPISKRGSILEDGTLIFPLPHRDAISINTNNPSGDIEVYDPASGYYLSFWELGADQVTMVGLEGNEEWRRAEISDGALLRVVTGYHGKADFARPIYRDGILVMFN